MYSPSLPQKEFSLDLDHEQQRWLLDHNESDDEEEELVPEAQDSDSSSGEGDVAATALPRRLELQTASSILCRALQDSKESS